MYYKGGRCSSCPSPLVNQSRFNLISKVESPGLFGRNRGRCIQVMVSLYGWKEQEQTSFGKSSEKEEASVCLKLYRINGAILLLSLFLSLSLFLPRYNLLESTVARSDTEKVLEPLALDVLDPFGALFRFVVRYSPTRIKTILASFVFF